MEFLAFDNDDAISAKPSKFCLQCESQSQHCFIHTLSTTPYNPLTNTPTFGSGHSLSRNSYVSPLSFADSIAEIHTQVDHGPLSAGLEAPCTCLREAVTVSEQLHYHQQTIADLPFDQTLSIAQLAVHVCEQYLRCKDCAKSLNSILCLNALQQTSACYRHLATSTSTSASTSAVGQEGEGRVFWCRIGAFHADATLQEDVWRAILVGEVGRAVRAVGELDGWLKEGGAGGVGGGGEKATERGIDKVTARYHKALIGGVARELEETARLIGVHGIGGSGPAKVVGFV